MCTGYWRQWADERFGDPPQGGSRSLQWSATEMEDLQEDPLAVHCFCVCSRSALLGDLGVSRSRKPDLSVLLIYPRIFFCVFTVYCRIVYCYMLLSVGCFGLVVVLAPLFLFGRICFVVLVMRKGRRAVESGP